MPVECLSGSPSAGSVCSQGKVGRERVHPCYAALHAQLMAPLDHVTGSANWQDVQVAALAQQPAPGKVELH